MAILSWSNIVEIRICQKRAIFHILLIVPSIMFQQILFIYHLQLFSIFLKFYMTPLFRHYDIRWAHSRLKRCSMSNCSNCPNLSFGNREHTNLPFNNREFKNWSFDNREFKNLSFDFRAHIIYSSFDNWELKIYWCL